MSFLFTHLITSWFVGTIYQLISKKKLSPYTWLFLIAGAIIPDLDFLIDWTLHTDIHRTITHSITFAVLFPLLVYGILRIVGDKKSKYYSLALSVGIITHLLLDMCYAPGIALLWPGMINFSYHGISLVNHMLPSLFNSTLDRTIHFLREMLIDTALGAGWLFYLGLRKRINFS